MQGIQCIYCAGITHVDVYIHVRVIVQKVVYSKLIVLCVAQCHMAMTQVHLFQWSNSDSVDGMALLSVSTLCLTQFLMLASHVW